MEEFDRIRRFVNYLRAGALLPACVAYAFTALIILGIVDYLVPAVGLPPATTSLVLILLLLGLPVVVATALLQRGKNTEAAVSEDPPQSADPVAARAAPETALKTATDPRKVRKRRWLAVAGAAITVPTLAMTASLLVDTSDPGTEGLIRSTRQKPIIIGIYPSDEFGALQSAGLHAALAPYRTVVDFREVTAPLQDMKNGDFDVGLDALRQLVDGENVVGIVGPSVTEVVAPVLDLLTELQFPAPVMLLTAAGREDIRWGERPLALFRISEGINERAANFTALIRDADARDIPLYLAVEKPPNADSPDTYGNKLFQAIAGALPDTTWKRMIDDSSVRLLDYRSGHPESIYTVLEEAVTTHAIIMCLCVGPDQAALMKRFYSTSSADTPRARIGGWMNAFAFEDLLRRDSLRVDRVFEVTDVDITGGVLSPNEVQRRFLRSFDALTPATRDQVFAFDSATLLVQALSAVAGTLDAGEARYPLIDASASDELLRYLEEEGPFHLMSNIVEFRDGQATTTHLRVTGFSDGAWYVLPHAELLTP